ncbi:MAG: hypothetical protein SCH71_04175 [Desulfobulbaceae bacterium]|nr:hypothetical protein [Desulfobulbaceae bacterium]
MRIRILLSVFVFVFFFLVSGCGPDDSPEEQIRLFIKAGEEAAEARDAGALKKLIAENYEDAHRRTRRDITALAGRYFLANKNIHIFTRVGKLLFSEKDTAELQLYVAMTGRNAADSNALLNMQADLYLFDLLLVWVNKEWRLMSADWRPAGREDFF